MHVPFCFDLQRGKDCPLGQDLVKEVCKLRETSAADVEQFEGCLVVAAAHMLIPRGVFLWEV